MVPPRTLLVWTENYWIGGCDRFLVDLIGGLRDRPVRVVLAGNPHPEFDAWLQERVPWVMPRRVIPIANLVHTPLRRLEHLRARVAAPSSVPFSSGPAATGDNTAVLTGIAGLRYSQAAINLSRLVRLMRDLRPDVLLINNGGYPGGESCRIAAAAARRAGVPRIVQFVHNMASPPAWPPRLEAALDRRVDESVDLWVTAAHRASARLAEMRGIAASRIDTIHYGIAAPDPLPSGGDPALRAELGFTGEGPGLAVVANLEPRKGLLVLVHAIAELRARGVVLPTAIVGEGPMRGELQRELAAAGLTSGVRLLGWREDVTAILAEASMFVLPSLANECLPYVILEAMAQSLPVVSTDVAGIPEMVCDEENGRVVAPGNATALATAIAEVASEPARAAQMGVRGRQRVIERFALPKMVERMEDVLVLA